MSPAGRGAAIFRHRRCLKYRLPDIIGRDLFKRSHTWPPHCQGRCAVADHVAALSAGHRWRQHSVGVRSVAVFHALEPGEVEPVYLRAGARDGRGYSHNRYFPGAGAHPGR